MEADDRTGTTIVTSNTLVAAYGSATAITSDDVIFVPNVTAYGGLVPLYTTTLSAAVSNVASAAYADTVFFAGGWYVTTVRVLACVCVCASGVYGLTQSCRLGSAIFFSVSLIVFSTVPIALSGVTDRASTADLIDAFNVSTGRMFKRWASLTLPRHMASALTSANGVLAIAGGRNGAYVERIASVIGCSCVFVSAVRECMLTLRAALFLLYAI